MTMTPRQLTETASLNIEFYRKAAKALLKAARAGDRDANDRLKATGATGETPKNVHVLHVAQLAIAREQGFASWPRFVAFITDSNLDFQGLVIRFIDAATSDLTRARNLLADHPELKGAGVYVALVMGEWQAVAQAIETDPDFAARPSGPDDVEPIIYACFSRFGHHRAPEAADLALTLRLLLNHGADPNTAFESEDGPLSCLYAASGLLGNVEMTRLLLEAGADPDDGESLYHATEQPDFACMKLLLAHGARVAGSNAIKHVLDWESPEGLRLLLDAGGDPNETNPEGDTALHWAVRRGRSTEIAAMLLDAGVDIDAVRQDGRTAYALAVILPRDGAGILMLEELNRAERYIQQPALQLLHQPERTSPVLFMFLSMTIAQQLLRLVCRQHPQSSYCLFRIRYDAAQQLYIMSRHPTDRLFFEQVCTVYYFQI